MADSYWMTPVGPFAPAIGAAFNTFTTRQDVSTLPVPVILGNQLRVGSMVKIEAEGEFSTTGTPTLAIGVYFGAPGASGAPAAITTVIAESAAITTGSAAASWPWRLEWRGKVVTMGTSGSVVGQGDLEFGTSLTAFSSNAIPATLALRTIVWDTTIARAVGVCATYGTSSASNAIKTYACTVALMN